MAEVALPIVRIQRRWSPLALRWRIAAILALLTFVAFVAGSTILSQPDAPSHRGEDLELAAVSVVNRIQLITHVQVLARHGALGPAEVPRKQDCRRGRDVDQI